MTNLWILNIRAHRCKNNNVYALHNTETDTTNTDLLDTHRQLGHPSFKRMRDLKLASDEPTKPAKKRRTSHAPPSCPTCVTAKMRRSASPASSSPDTRATGPWETVYIDLSGKVRARCFSNVSYFVVFICDYSGTKYLDFLKQKSDFFLAYKRFITHTQHHPRKIHTDRGGEFRSLEFSTYLEENHTNHVMCAPDEHFSIGCAEMQFIQSTRKPNASSWIQTHQIVSGILQSDMHATSPISPVDPELIPSSQSTSYYFSRRRTSPKFLLLAALPPPTKTGDCSQIRALILHPSLAFFSELTDTISVSAIA